MLYLSESWAKAGEVQQHKNEKDPKFYTHPQYLGLTKQIL